MKHRFISFLSDFGLTDDFVGTCHGVMKRIAPDVEIIDVTHGIAPQAVLPARSSCATRSRTCLPAFISRRRPGSRRDATALRSRRRRGYLRRPRQRAAGPRRRVGRNRSAHELAESRLRARARFAHVPRPRPLLARRGAPRARCRAGGARAAPLAGRLVRLDIPRPVVGAGSSTPSVLYVDRFGNMQLNLTRDDLDRIGIRPGRASSSSSRRALLRDRGADVRRRATRRDRPVRRLVPQHRDRNQPRQRGGHVLGATWPTRLLHLDQP